MKQILKILWILLFLLIVVSVLLGQNTSVQGLKQPSTKVVFFQLPDTFPTRVLVNDTIVFDLYLIDQTDYNIKIFDSYDRSVTEILSLYDSISLLQTNMDKLKDTTSLQIKNQQQLLSNLRTQILDHNLIVAAKHAEVESCKIALEQATKKSLLDKIANFDFGIGLPVKYIIGGTILYGAFQLGASSN
jgi:hypothetical protein